MSVRWEQRLERGGAAVELLRVPASLFALAVRARGAAYDKGWLATKRLPVPVICAGNVTTGGTGKTPLVAWIARELVRRGFRPGILSRGYRADASGANDEALLLARLLPDVAHVQDADRARGGAELVARGCDAVVLDDGFQHRKLARDVDVVLVDATRPWGLATNTRSGSVRALLPRGLLREPLEALARADAIVITRSDQVDPQQRASLETELGRFAPGRPIVLARHAPRAWVDATGERAPLDLLRGVEADLVSAIGNPDAFEHAVRALGVRVGEHRRFADHHRYAKGDVAGLGERGRTLVTTEKDAVKLAPLGIAFRALAIEQELVRDGAVLEALLDALPRPGETPIALEARRPLRD